ncbi:MAG: hypothetical protein DSY93_00595 [SAR324 cluster bacterium]|uniref:Uncharacterized protein n=1 Tax=SAR324 cluster bacterium TaxID=2024889 RepID=A0A432HAZ3_9DELT|nr:MAG: hypothetical protein DSY93_00595 [SAR324 cluster bacterium]
MVLITFSKLKTKSKLSKFRFRIFSGNGPLYFHIKINPKKALKFQFKVSIRNTMEILSWNESIQVRRMHESLYSINKGEIPKKY